MINFELGSNYIKFEENLCKTFHGGITDLKYVPKTIEHICHEVGEKHERCILELYKLYFGLTQSIGKYNFALYFRPSMKNFSYVKSPVGVNSLNAILPDMCKKVGIKVKTAHCLRVTCATKLFTSGMKKKMIRERTGHKSNALFSYQKPSDSTVTAATTSIVRMEKALNQLFALVIVPLHLQMSKYSHQQCSLIVMSISVLIRKSNVKVYRTDANK